MISVPISIDDDLARAAGPQVLPSPLAIPGFTMKQYWHARYHHDAACRWRRDLYTDLFMKSGSDP